MNTHFEETREKFMRNNNFFAKSYLPEEEQARLNKIVKQGKSREERIFEKYKSKRVGLRKYKFYVLNLVEISDEELNQYILMEMLDLTRSMQQKQNIMKNIMIFWLFLMMMVLAGLLYVVINIASLLGLL